MSDRCYPLGPSGVYYAKGVASAAGEALSSRRLVCMACSVGVPGSTEHLVGLTLGWANVGGENRLLASSFELAFFLV